MQQDNQIKTLQDNLNKLIENAPAGFLPQTYYGLVEGETQTYRADQQTIENVALPSAPAFGKVYALTSPTETEGYVPTYIAFLSGSQTQNTCEIIIKGDYNKSPTLFDIVDMSTGEVANSQTITGLSFSQQAASYVGEYSPKDNYNHQITALHDVSFNEDNVVYASIDVNSDGVYNWVKIGNYRNGITGSSVRTVTGSNFQSVISLCLENDILLAGEDFTADDYVFNIGDLYTITTLSPLVLTLSGNIRGAQGATGATGATGADGTTPSIVDGYWYLGTTNTNVKAEGKDGQNGVDGNSFSIQTPLYSAPNNVGVPNNVDPQGNALATLPTLPQTDISGKGYVVYDPLTTPLTPFYDLYYANNNDTEWTIIHPYTGLAGKNGVDGLTPSIQNGYWYIGNENTGVNARGLQGPQGIQGPQGPQGPQGEPGVVGEFSHIDFAPSTGGLVYSNGKATYTGTFSLEDTESNQYTSEGQVAINIEAGDNVTIDADETNTNLVINATGGGSSADGIKYQSGEGTFVQLFSALTSVENTLIGVALSLYSNTSQTLAFNGIQLPELTELSLPSLPLSSLLPPGSGTWIFLSRSPDLTDSAMNTICLTGSYGLPPNAIPDLLPSGTSKTIQATINISLGPVFTQQPVEVFIKKVYNNQIVIGSFYQNIFMNQMGSCRWTILYR